MLSESVSGELLRELRIVAGIGLRNMAARTSFAPGYLSLVETGKRPMSNAVVRAYRDVLGDPTLGLGDVDAERLAVTMADPHGAGASSLADMAAILEHSRHLEDRMGPTMVTPVVRGLDAMARTLVATNRAHITSATLAAEIAIYRGWLEHDTGSAHIANRSLDDAARLAQEACDRSHLAHALCFRAYTARCQGDYARAVDLTEAGAAVDGAHPVLRVYAKHQRAEFLALRRETRKAAKMLTIAEKAAEATDGIELPNYGYWYTSGFWAVHRGVVLAVMGRRSDAVNEATQGVAVMPVAHRTAGWLGTLLDAIEPGWGTSRESY